MVMVSRQSILQDGTRQRAKESLVCAWSALSDGAGGCVSGPHLLSDGDLSLPDKCLLGYLSDPRAVPNANMNGDPTISITV